MPSRFSGEPFLKVEQNSYTATTTKTATVRPNRRLSTRGSSKVQFDRKRRRRRHEDLEPGLERKKKPQKAKIKNDPINGLRGLQTQGSAESEMRTGPPPYGSHQCCAVIDLPAEVGHRTAPPVDDVMRF